MFTSSMYFPFWLAELWRYLNSSGTSGEDVFLSEISVNYERMVPILVKTVRESRGFGGSRGSGYNFQICPSERSNLDLFGQDKKDSQKKGLWRKKNSLANSQSTKEKGFGSMTDVHSFSQTPLLFLTFLQQGPSLNTELQNELENLHCKVKLSSAPSGLSDHVVYRQDCFTDSNIECDGELQTDGHSVHRGLLNDLPQVDLVLPVPAEEAHAVREVAAELIRMADEFNQLILSQAAECLTTKLSNSSPKCFWSCLSQGVDSLLKDVPGVQSERMMMALTFSLAKAVCERAPRLLCDLCNAMNQFTFMTRPR